MSRMKVYIASPYTAPTPEEVEANVNKVLKVAVRLINEGYNVYVPHLSHYIEQVSKEMSVEISHDKWVDLDTDWLAHCDAMLVLGLSPGVIAEIEFAIAHGISVYGNAGGKL